MTIIKQIVFYKGIKRSDMTKEVLNGYREKMIPEIENDFMTFAYYRSSLRFKIKLLLVPYQTEVSKRAFIKAKMQVIFNTI